MIGTIGGSDLATGPGQASNRAQVSREQFLQILVSELSHQDPLEPMDNSQFLQQLVGLQTLEQTAALTDSLKSFERFLQMTSAAGLIGWKVKGIAQGGEQVQGVVQKVVLDKNNVQLVIGNKNLPVSGVQEVLPAIP